MAESPGGPVCRHPATLASAAGRTGGAAANVGPRIPSTWETDFAGPDHRDYPATHQTVTIRHHDRQERCCVGTQPLVLVADDEPRITKLVSIALSEEGFRVVTATGGEDALAKAEEIRPDIVLLDIVMPDLDGIEVIRQLREQRPVPVILLTAKGATADKAQGRHHDPGDPPATAARGPRHGPAGGTRGEGSAQAGNATWRTAGRIMRHQTEHASCAMSWKWVSALTANAASTSPSGSSR